MSKQILANDKLFKYLLVTDEDIQKITIDYSGYPQEAWDPVNDFDKEKVRKNSATLLAKLEKLKQHPGRPGRQLKKTILLSVLLVFIFFSLDFFGGAGFLSFFSIIGGIIAVGIIYTFYRKLMIDMINILIGLRKKWYYDPYPDGEKAAKLKNRYPEIFNRGHSGLVEDQFWGQFKTDKGFNDFYSALFQFDITHRDSKGKSSTRTYHYHFFSIRLAKSWPSDFYLFTPGTRIEYAGIKGIRVETQSPEFNKIFRLYSGTSSDSALQLVNLLPNSLINQLLELHNNYGAFGLLFSGNCLIFIFNGALMQKLKTSFFKEIVVHPDDLGRLEEKMNKITILTNEFFKF